MARRESIALLRSVLRKGWYAVTVPILSALAGVNRRRMSDALVIAVTGSCGKSTTKELIYGVLASRGPGIKSRWSENGIVSAFVTVMKMRSSHTFCVQEVGAWCAGRIAGSLRVLRPNIGVVLNVGTDHRKLFPSMDALTQEKARVVGCLSPTGVAVLNADDQRVRTMGGHTGARVLTFGLAADADVRAEDIDGNWPETLSLTVVHNGRRVRLRSRLYGSHFVSSVLAAMATGIACGISLDDCASGIASVDPLDRRLTSHVNNAGVAFLTDAWKASVGSLPPLLEVARCAKARQKWLVIGTLADYSDSASHRYAQTAKKCLEVADHVVFVGAQAHLVRHAECPEDKSLVWFPRMEGAARYVQEHAQTGDLVILKGSGKTDHVERILLCGIRSVRCWRDRCGREVNCLRCRRL